MPDELTPDTVRQAYRLFLDREPESEQVVEAALRYGSIRQLRRALLSSREFLGSNIVSQALVPPTVAPLEIEWETDEASEAALFAHIKRTWARLGVERPHHSVLGSDDFAPARIEANKAAFFASGAQDGALMQAVLARHRLDAAMFPRMFEYGCGVGRVTPFFAKDFQRVVACDVSPTHLRLAREATRGLTNIDLIQVQDERFGMIEPFDAWFSRIVLQHNPPPITAAILRRMVTMLAPGGVAVFQIPTYHSRYEFSVRDYLSKVPEVGDVEMHVLPQPVIFQIAKDADCEILEVWPDSSTGGSSAHWISNLIALRKSVKDADHRR